ncbi:MAG: response regulator [Desulfobacteraceae bacterium 4572_88]|nr:MAG: response regulator [Desulfobacteraceae bacterium 4572_88]
MAHILIVDDDTQVREMLRQMLEDAGFEVTEAPDGKVAMKLYLESPSDMVLTDLIMPEQEGLETIQSLKAEFPDAKIIAMSGGGRLGPESYLKMASAFGVLHTFTKPVRRNELLEKIREVLGLEKEE